MNRKFFIQILVGAITLLLGFVQSSCKEQPGIVSVQDHGKILSAVPSEPEDEQWVYQLAAPFQISDTEMGLMVNIRRGSVKTIDLEVGNDLLIYDQFPLEKPKQCFAVNRRTFIKHPNTGEELYVSRYPVIGGFVPLGARLDNGEPHPHAGTGFGVSRVIGFPADMSSRIWIDMPEPYMGFELYQFSYDGTTFRSEQARITEGRDVLPDRELTGAGLGYAIPDGEDLIWAVSAKEEGENYGSGLTRWRRINDTWQVIEYIPVTGTDLSTEPSVIRDMDGSLLFTSRGSGASQRAQKLPDAVELGEKNEKSIRLWRSADAGKTWEEILYAPLVRSGTPLTISAAVDGSPYIAGNPFTVNDSRGRELSSIEMREVLKLWPLSAGRGSLEEPVMVRNCPVDFGDAPLESIWRADHPMGTTLRFADGQWRHLLFYRVLTRKECVSDAPVTPVTGTYMAEITSAGRVQPLWNFRSRP